MSKFIKFAATMALGAVVGMLMDPDRGKARRARLKDQAMAGMRDAREGIENRARYESGRIKGAAYEITHEDQAPETDAELLHKIRSEAIGPSGMSGVEIDVRDGMVTITGDPDDTHLRNLLARIRAVAGVEDVVVLTTSD